MNNDEALDILFPSTDPVETLREKQERMQQEMLVQHLTRIKKFQQDVKRVAVTPDGQELLKFIFQLCGYADSSVVASSATGEINHMAVIYNQGRRNVWLELRRHIPPDVLAELEKPPQEDYSCLETKPQETQVQAPL